MIETQRCKTGQVQCSHVGIIYSNKYRPEGIMCCTGCGRLEAECVGRYGRTEKMSFDIGAISVYTIILVCTQTGLFISSLCG